MGRVSGGINISGVIDGATAITEVCALNRPLLQYFDKARFSPDFASLWNNGNGANDVPTVIVKAFDSATGADVSDTVSLTTVYYNDAAITWGNGGIATAPDIVAGKLLKTTVSYGGKNIPCVKFIGNVADSNTNPDDDFIYFDGTCVVGGGQISFKKAGRPVMIREIESTTAGFDLILTVPNNMSGSIYRAASGAPVSTKRVATLFKNGNPLDAAAMAGFTFEWADITYDNVINLTGSSTGITISQTLIANDTITLAESAVDSLMQLRCIVKDAQQNVVAVGMCGVPDLCDELQCGWMVSDYPGNNTEVEFSNMDRVDIRDGGAKKFRPFVKTGGVPAQAFANQDWTFGLDNNNGDAVATTSLVTSGAVGNRYIIIAYGDVVQTNNGIKTKRPLVLSATSNIG